MSKKQERFKINELTSYLRKLENEERKTKEICRKEIINKRWKVNKILNNNNAKKQRNLDKAKVEFLKNQYNRQASGQNDKGKKAKEKLEISKIQKKIRNLKLFIYIYIHTNMFDNLDKMNVYKSIQMPKLRQDEI